MCDGYPSPRQNNHDHNAAALQVAEPGGLDDAGISAVGVGLMSVDIRSHVRPRALVRYSGALQARCLVISPQLRRLRAAAGQGEQGPYTVE